MGEGWLGEAGGALEAVALVLDHPPASLRHMGHRQLPYNHLLERTKVQTACVRFVCHMESPVCKRPSL